MLLPPTGDKRVPTIGDSQGGRPKPLATRKELRLLVFGLVGLLGMVVWFFRAPPPREALIASPTETTVQPMAMPDIDRLPELPDAAAVANARTDIEAMVRAGEVPSVKFGLDAPAVAWAERLLAEDAQRRRIPQRITTEELATEQIRPGQLVVLNARLHGVRMVSMPGRDDASYRWLSLALDDDQYAVALQVMTPDTVELTVNDRVHVLGRYLGQVPTPTDVDEAMVPTLATSIVTPVTVEGGDNGRTGLAGYQGAVPLVDDLYRDVDDERPLVESHPYYLTLGRVKSEMGTPELAGPRLDANRLANAIHQDPAAYRGKPVVVRGAVWHAWEDAMVATDRPFDVRRVVRVLIYRRDIGPITEDGKTVTKSVLRIFELAAITDQPLPQPGEFIVASGRFMKWRAIPAARHPGMENLLGSMRQSGNVYTMFIVAGPWRIEEPVEINWTPLVVLLSIGGVLFAGMVLWFVNRDRGAEQRLKASVATLRRRRRELQSRPAVPADHVPGASAPESPDASDR